MAFEQKPNSCAIFDNTRSPDKSDLNGSIEIACPKCSATSSWWINGWHKVSQKGTKYISLSLKPKSASARAGDEIPL